MPPCRASLTQNRSLICKQWALHDGFWRFLSSYFLLASSMCYKTKCKMRLIIIKSHGPYFSSLNPYPINCASCALANMKSPLWHLLTHQAGIDAVLIPNWTKGGDSAYTLGRIMILCTWFCVQEKCWFHVVFQHNTLFSPCKAVCLPTKRTLRMDVAWTERRGSQSGPWDSHPMQHKSKQKTRKTWDQGGRGRMALT